jgi:hypothetical protein
VHELRNPPSAEFVKYVFVSSYAAFGAALLIAGLVVVKDWLAGGK